MEIQRERGSGLLIKQIWIAERSRVRMSASRCVTTQAKYETSSQKRNPCLFCHCQGQVTRDCRNCAAGLITVSWAHNGIQVGVLPHLFRSSVDSTRMVTTVTEGHLSKLLRQACPPLTHTSQDYSNDSPMGRKRHIIPTQKKQRPKAFRVTGYFWF